MSRASTLLTLCLLPGFVLACDSSNNDDSDTDAETLIAVDPADFPSVANCSRLEDGSVPRGTYVAELIDVTGIVDSGGQKVDEFRVQSSAPVDCGTAVGFALAVPERSYEVIVRVYTDLGADDLCTLEGTTVTVVRPENGKCPKALDAAQTLATPSTTLRCYGWRAQPKRAGNPALAVEYHSVYTHYCVESDE